MADNINNGQEKSKRKQLARLTQVQFFQGCETLRKNKQWFLDNKPTLIKAAEKLSELCGFNIGKGSVREMQEATKILWVPIVERKAPNPKTKGMLVRAMKVMTIQLAKLIEEAGSKPTLAFQNFANELLDMIDKKEI